MTSKLLYAAWAVLFILCACLGFIPAPGTGPRILMIFLAVCSFLPPFALAGLAWRQQALRPLRLLRGLSAVSLGLTLAALIANFMAAAASRSLGNFLHSVLIIVSAPMICGQYWVISLSLWAVLLWVCIFMIQKLKKSGAAG